MCGDKGFWSTLHVMTMYIYSCISVHVYCTEYVPWAHVHNVHTCIMSLSLLVHFDDDNVL